MDAFLNSILRGLITYSVGIFLLLGLGILIYLMKFLRGLREWRQSVFGLERGLAQRKIISATTGLTLLLLLMIGEFLLVTVVGPQMPGQTGAVTSPGDPLATPTVTLSAEETLNPTTFPTPAESVQNLESQCVEDVLEITSPEDGEAVSGTVEIIGSVNVENFGSYKYEYSTTGDINWITIAAGNQLKLDESLGSWFTSALTPGTYYLQLVPLNNAGEELMPCIISVEVVLEE